MARCGRAYVLVAWNCEQDLPVSLAVSASLEKLERLAGRLSLVPLNVDILEADSLDEDAEEAAVVAFDRSADPVRDEAADLSAFCEADGLDGMLGGKSKRGH